jgi:mRNA interferase MazF
LNRGELWTVSGGADSTGKPRPSLIVRDERYGSEEVVTVCPLTSQFVDAPFLRLIVEPTADNGLRQRSAVQINRVSTVRIAKLGRRLGRLEPEAMRDVSTMLAAYLGLVG